MNEVINRLKILQDVIDGRLTTSLASQRLGLTDGHCRRQLARYREPESLALALANRRRGLRVNRQLVPGLAELDLCIIPITMPTMVRRSPVRSLPSCSAS